MAIRTLADYPITFATPPGSVAVAWLLVTVVDLFLAITYWLIAVFTHRKLPFVTPGVKNMCEGDSKLNNHEEEVIVN